MSTTIRTTSEKQMNQIRRFVKKNKNYCTITQENGVYTIAIIGLTISESEKFIKNFIKNQPPRQNAAGALRSCCVRIHKTNRASLLTENMDGFL